MLLIQAEGDVLTTRMKLQHTEEASLWLYELACDCDAWQAKERAESDARRARDMLQARQIGGMLHRGQSLVAREMGKADAGMGRRQWGAHPRCGTCLCPGRG